MKDFILAEEQIDCAAGLGASAVLLIADILPKNRLERLIEYAHLSEREVLLECASRAEVESALASEADMIGVNNRDLRTFQVNIERTKEFTEGLEFDRPLVSLSGFATRADVLKVRDIADAVLVGTSLIEQTATVAELIGA
jgi:indole-3-glycerol phosphate synthase